jgi:hypothetical protein
MSFCVIKNSNGQFVGVEKNNQPSQLLKKIQSIPNLTTEQSILYYNYLDGLKNILRDENDEPVLVFKNNSPTNEFDLINGGRVYYPTFKEAIEADINRKGVEHGVIKLSSIDQITTDKTLTEVTEEDNKPQVINGYYFLPETSQFKVTDKFQRNLPDNSSTGFINRLIELNPAFAERQVVEQAPQSPDIRFSIIGEQGARNLDQAEEATFRMDNLLVAKEMEQTGKTPKEIRLATGWERGADSLWRYEIGDLKPIKNIKEIPLRTLEFGNDTYTYKEVSLYALVGDSDIFKAFPRAKDIKVVLYDFTHPNLTSGEFRAADSVINEDVITLWGVDYKKDTLTDNQISTLNHEAQHFIQKEEGFSRGGNEDMFSKNNLPINPRWIEYNKEENKKIIEEYNQLYQSPEYEKELFESNNLFEVDYGKRIDALQKEKTRDNREEVSKKVDAIFEEYEKVSKEMFPTLTRIDELAKKGVVREPNKTISKFEAYKRLMGEVEARNVQKRIGMNPQQRRETLLQETEDVAREDQIFLRDNLDSQQLSAQQNNLDLNLNDKETLQQTLTQLQLSGLANNVYFLTPNEIENKLVELGKEAKPTTQGFTNFSDIYINTQAQNPLQTSLHEYGHIYLNKLKQQRPDLYAKGIELAKSEEAQDIINFVKKNQPKLQEGSQEFNEEVLAEVIGRSSEMLITDKKSDLKNWLLDVWEWIKQQVGLLDMTAEQVANLTLQEYASAIGIDMLSGEEILGQEAQEYFTRNADRFPLTLQVFQRPEFVKLQGKQVNPITVLNSLNQSGIKQIEKDLIKRVIEESYQGQKKISYDELEATVRANIMPLERIFTSSYADYGMDNLGDGNYGEANTIILNAPIEHGVTGHFSGDFKASGRKNIKYQAKQLNDNTWVAVEEGYESQANDNNIYQFVGTAGTKEAVDMWIVKYNLSQGIIYDNKKVLVYQDAYDQADNVIPVAGFDTEQEAQNFINENKDNYTYNLDYVDENYIKDNWQLEDTNKGMFGHIRVWQDGEIFNVAELQSDYFQKNNARKSLLNIKLSEEDYKKLNENRKKNNIKLFKELGYVLTEDTDQFTISYDGIILKQITPSAYNTKIEAEDFFEDYLRGIPQIILDINNLPNNLRFDRDTQREGVNYVVYQLKNNNDVILAEGRDRQEVVDNYRRKESKKLSEAINKSDDLFNKERNKLTQKLEEEKYKKLSPQEKQFIASQKEWEKRMVREAIKEATLSGATELRFPTPYTLSVIEGYVTIGEEDKAKTELRSAMEGEVVNYLGTEYIVEYTDIPNGGTEVTVRPVWDFTKISYDAFQDMIKEEGEPETYVESYDGEFVYYTNSLYNNSEIIDTKDVSATKEDFSIENDLSDTQQTVARKYEQIAETLKQERGEENFEIVTDENGFDWYSTKIAQEEVNRPVIAFQQLQETDNSVSFNSPSQEAILDRMIEDGQVERLCRL